MSKTPTTQAELEDYLGDGTKVAAAIKDGSIKDVIKNYANATMASDPSIQQQISEQAQAAALEMFKKNGADTDKLNFDPTAGPVNAYHKLQNPRAIAAPLNRTIS